MSDAQEIMDEAATPTEEFAATENPTGDEPPATVPFDAAYDRRRQRIFDHRVEAQAEPNTLIACLAGVNSDLLDTELIVAERLREKLAASGGSLEAIERYRPLMDMMLRLSKQIMQLTQIEQRSRKDGGEGTATKPR
jgi:hypothetical protein